MLNKCEFIGRVGKEISVRSFGNGGQVVNLSLACSEKYKDRDGNRQEKTTWVPVVIFNEHLIKVAQNYVKKGDLLYVSGAFQTRKWSDNNGQDKYTTEIVLQKFNGELTMLGGRSDNTQTGGGGEQSHNQDGGGFGGNGAGNDLDSDSIPF